MLNSMPKYQRMSGLLVIGALVITALLLSYPLLLSGYLNGDDFNLHLRLSQQFMKALEQGVFPPQWVADVNAGCGSANFIFYPTLTYYIYALIGLVEKDILTLLNIASFAGLLVSGMTMYLFCRLFLTRAASLSASISYMALPYHLIDLYTRSALAEFWSFVWIPLIMFFMIRLKEKPISSFAGLSVSYAALIQTHLPTALLMSFLLSFFILFDYLKTAETKVCFIRLCSLSLGIGLAAHYLVPAVIEQRYVDAGVADRYWFWIQNNNFLFSRNTLYKINELVSIVAVCTTLIPAVNLAVRFTAGNTNEGGGSFCEKFFSLAGIGVFIMMFPISKPLWEIIPFVQQVELPWRLLTLSTFCAAVCLGFITQRIRTLNHTPKKVIVYAILGTMAAIVVINMYYSLTTISRSKNISFDFVSRLRTEQNFSIQADSSPAAMARNYSLCYPDNQLLFDPFFHPRWAAKRVIVEDFAGLQEKSYARYGQYILFPIGKEYRKGEKADRELLIPHALLKDYILLQKGDGTLTVDFWEPESRKFHAEISVPCQFLIRTFYYPRWKAYINGKEFPITPDPHTGLITMNVPEGRYNIELKFSAGVFGLIGRIVTGFSACGMVILLFMLRKNARIFLERREKRER